MKDLAGIACSGRALLRMDEGAGDVGEDGCARLSVERAAVGPHRCEQLTQRDTLGQCLDGVEAIAAQGDVEEFRDQRVLKIPNRANPFEQLCGVQYARRCGRRQHRDRDQPHTVGRCGKVASKTADLG